MAGEAVLAALVGGLALWLVLQPLLRPRSTKNPVYEPLDLEDTPKGIALAALKEIEFDRETGKLSDADYHFLKAKYTAAAVEALRAEEGGSADLEDLIAARVRLLRTPAGDREPSCSTCGPRPEADAVFCSSCGRTLSAKLPCARCGAVLLAGSRFCEACGRTVAA
ncbi:MAG TPA: zinc ribbon domain-containing protein [Gemmatimonadales bacterium]|nr:zinc ribbon domain-containing protein [Gemmatimonadales bacterium]